MRVLLISWEYPPVIEGGLARHVRKLSEHLVQDGVEVHVLTRGGGRLPAEEERHGVVVHRVREPQFPKDASAFVRWVRVIACSRYMRSHVASVFGVARPRITVIPNGMDPRDLEPVEPDLAGLRAGYARPEERLVLLVGRLVYEKGFHLALDALAPVISRLGDVRFVVAGTGTAGCLCVVADTGGLREVVPGDGTVGLRFPSRDSAALRDVLEEVLTDDQARAQLVAEAREHVLRFDWGEVGRSTHALYRQLTELAIRV